MASDYEKFQRSVIGSDGKIADYIPRISPIGDFQRVTDLGAILNSWNNILLTPLRTYTFDPEYGSELYKFVFEPYDRETIDAIMAEIENRVYRYDDRAEITEIQVFGLPGGKGFSINIFVDYEGQDGKLTLTVDEATYFTFLRTD